VKQSGLAGELLAVIAGAVVGTGLRLGIDAALPHSDTGFPLSTLIINVLGAFALGLIIARLWRRVPAWARAGLGAGLLGSFTTFSALAVSLVSLSAANEWMLALVYFAATMILGLLAAFAGLRLGGGSAPVDSPPIDLPPIDLASE
jgi:fluoride exporter